MTVPAKRGRGRPKGSKNKRKLLSHANVQTICEAHRFNPAEKLIAIATDSDFDEDGRRIAWPLISQQRAAEKLFDAIHNKKALPGVADDDSNPGQYEIIFLEGESGFTLPGEADAEGGPGAVPEKSLQCPSDSPQSGQNSLRDQ
jgi:hypothetical protein